MSEKDRTGVRSSSSHLIAASNTRLATNAEFHDEIAITLYVLILNVAQQATAGADHFQQAQARRVIFAVRLQMFGEVVDARGQKRDLNFGRACVGVVMAVLADHFLLGHLNCGHVLLLYFLLVF